MRVIEINENMPSYSVIADPDDIILFNGVAYRVIAGDLCTSCDVNDDGRCGCMPFDCEPVPPDCEPGIAHDFILKRVNPEGGEE